MIMPHQLDVLDFAGVPLQRDVPLHKRVWWRVGGPADVFAEVETLAALSRLRAAATAAGVPVFLLGNGSNLLVADAGIRGLVIKLAGELAEVVATESVLDCGAGLKNNVLLARAAKHRWSGLDPLAGIPGTIGGAVRMNAGSLMGETSDILIDVDVVLPDGAVQTIPLTDLRMRYRHCELPPGAIVARARLHHGRVPYDESAARIQAFLEKRKATQPLDQPSCGSTFRNPPGDTAGRLIDAAGLKGFTIGGAQVSEKHANFVLNLGDATAKDIRAVIEAVMAKVEAVHGVKLHPEVEIAGAW